MDELFSIEEGAPVTQDVEHASNFVQTSAAERKADEDDFFSEDTTLTDTKENDTFDSYDDPSDDLSETDQLIESVLKQKGIPNIDSVQIINEDGNPEYVNFNSLSQEEKLAILNTNDSQMLTGDEINLVNFLRQNKISIEDYINYREQEAYKKGVASMEISSTVDEASDDEIFMAELRSKYPTLTEEELLQEMEREHQNEELFNKKVELLRQQYKEIEEAENQEKMKAAELETAQERDYIQNSLIQAAQKVDNLFGLELDDYDKDEVLQYLLDRGADGKSAFTKALQDPNMLFYLSWCAIKGPEAFNALHQYYNKELEKARQRNTGSNGRTVKAVRNSYKDDSKGKDRYGMADIFK